jgi:hypothetical protein
MRVSPEDASLFYKLMWPLQFYVNQRLHILPDVRSIETYMACSQQNKLKVRQALYENADLVDAFVKENPGHLSDAELAIVRNWKRFVAGKFYIERFLKKYTVFIDDRDPARVYAVQALQDSLEDMFYGHPTPILVQAVLLPFKGQIVYDGMLNIYNIFFGGGIRGDLKEIYLAAKQNGSIIETLESEIQISRKRTAPTKPLPDWRPVVDELVQTTEKLKGGRSPVEAPALAVLRASARLAQAAVHNPDDLDALWKMGRKVATAMRRLETVLERAAM